jgi:hypothetical protein
VCRDGSWGPVERASSEEDAIFAVVGGVLCSERANAAATAEGEEAVEADGAEGAVTEEMAGGGGVTGSSEASTGRERDAGDRSTSASPR